MTEISGSITDVPDRIGRIDQGSVDADIASVPVVELSDGVSAKRGVETLQDPVGDEDFGMLVEVKPETTVGPGAGKDDADLLNADDVADHDPVGEVEQARAAVSAAFAESAAVPASAGSGTGGPEDIVPPGGNGDEHGDTPDDDDEGDDDPDRTQASDEALDADEAAEMEDELRQEEQRLTEEERAVRKVRDVELIHRWKDGDNDAAGELIGHYERFADMKASQMHRRFDTRLEIEDIEQEGRLAFLRAAKGWDSEKGQLLTYAGIAVEQKMLRALREDSFQVHIPDHVGKVVQKIRALNNARLEEGQPQMGDQQIAEEFGLPLRAEGRRTFSVEAIRRADMLTRLIVSLDSGYAPNLTDHVSGAEARVNSDLAKPMLNLTGDEPLDHADGSTDRVMLEELLTRVTHWGTLEWEMRANVRDMQIVRMLTGMDGTGQPKTQTEIADHFGVSRQTISQRVDKGFNKLLYHASHSSIPRQQ